MPNICGRKAKMVVIKKGGVTDRHPLCKAHGDRPSLKQRGFRVVNATSSETCGQSMNIDRSLQAYGKALFNTSGDHNTAIDEAKKEFLKD